MDTTMLAVARHRAHERILEVLQAHATGANAARVEEIHQAFRAPQTFDGIVEGFVLAEELRALAEVVDQLATAPSKAKAKV